MPDSLFRTFVYSRDVQVSWVQLVSTLISFSGGGILRHFHLLHYSCFYVWVCLKSGGQWIGFAPGRFECN